MENTNYVTLIINDVEFCSTRLTEGMINLTPHIINIRGEEVLDVPASGVIARCSQSNKEVGHIGRVPLTRQTFGEVYNLPEPVKGVYFVVSRLVASARPDRHDLVVPGPLLRNEAGQPCGCNGLSVIF